MRRKEGAMAPMLIMSVALAVAGPSAASFRHGTLPSHSPYAVAAGEVLLEVAVEVSGGVGEIRTLRSTPPFTDLLRAAVKVWAFEPARTVGGVAVPSRLLVGGFYSSAIPVGPGPTLGEPARDVASASAGVPFPSRTVTASFPHLTYVVEGGQVLLEFAVAADGSFTVQVVGETTAPLRDAALEAAQAWRFRAVGVPSLAYVVFSFRLGR
jgi:hypothetical protein